MSNPTLAATGDDDANRIEQKVIDVIVERLHVDRAEITPDARLFVDGGDPLRELTIPRP